ncbi:MAG: GYD domain-containing protein [Sedimentisphaerales bacterium]|nr:GYD domain-containing protein [Sedimentisphaerales bacterium]
MASFISLVNFTQKGIANFRDTADRGATFKAMAEKVGVSVKEIYWTIGSYDAAMVLEAPDDESVAAAMLGLSSLGNVKTQTLRAFTPSEIKGIIAKVPQ